MNHVAIVHAETALKLLHGDKLLESRFHRGRPPGAWHARPGDRLFFKVRGGDLRVACRVGEVLRFDGLTPERVMALEAEWWELVHGTGHRNPAYWQGKARADFLALVEVREVREICVPAGVLPRSSPWASAWWQIPDDLADEIEHHAALSLLA